MKVHYISQNGLVRWYTGVPFFNAFIFKTAGNKRVTADIYKCFLLLIILQWV